MREYYEAINYGFAANLETDEDAKAALYGQCFTAFTRSQVRAMQVYNALVPPATGPADLGLPAYVETAWP